MHDSSRLPTWHRHIPSHLPMHVPSRLTNDPLPFPEKAHPSPSITQPVPLFHSFAIPAFSGICSSCSWIGKILPKGKMFHHRCPSCLLKAASAHMGFLLCWSHQARPWGEGLGHIRAQAPHQPHPRLSFPQSCCFWRGDWEWDALTIPQHRGVGRPCTFHQTQSQ